MAAWYYVFFMTSLCKSYLILWPFLLLALGYFEVGVSDINIIGQALGLFVLRLMYKMPGRLLNLLCFCWSHLAKVIVLL